jgi:hypothetical protein
MPCAMTALPATNPDETRLREFIAQLEDCEITDERDQLLDGMIEEAKKILTRRPKLMRRWLLGLDRINKRFMVYNITG